MQAIVVNQLLWTAGYSLMAGGAVPYFLKDLGASGFELSLILTAPELLGLVSLSTPGLSRILFSRKSTWLTTLLLSRLLLLTLPLMAISEAIVEQKAKLWIVIGAYAGASMLQAISYTALLSWLSDLAPARRYGRFFAAQELSSLAMKILFLVLAGVITRTAHGSAGKNLMGYAILFSIGIVLTAISLIPLWRFIDSRYREKSSEATLKGLQIRFGGIGRIWPLLMCNLHLAFCQGLTQSVFFGYQTKVLGLSLLTYNLLLSWLYAVQFVGGLWLGREIDARRGKMILVWSMLLVSLSMPCWIVSAWWGWEWLIVAFTLWGGFVGVNLAYKTLLLRGLSDDRQLGIAIFYSTGGLMAGVSGLIGGYWLDQLLKNTSSADSFFGTGMSPYHLLMVISWVGRVTAVAWLIPFREPEVSSSVLPGQESSMLPRMVSS